MNPFKTFFYSFTRSLFEPKYYKDVAKANFWFSFKYLWFLIFILVFIKSIFLGNQYLKIRPRIQPGVNSVMSYAKGLYPKELELKIRNGRLSTNVKEPYIFDLKNNNWQKEGVHFLTIDTKGSIENYPDYNSYVLATRNAVVYPSRSTGNNIEKISVFYFREIKNDLTLNKNIYDKYLKKLQPYSLQAVKIVNSIAFVFLFLFLIFGSFFWTLSIMFGLLFLVFFVWIINLIFKKKYSYGALYRMGMHAATWPILLVEVVKYLKLPFYGFYTPVFLIWIMVILFSQKTNK